jgi:hypothetical protein
VKILWWRLALFDGDGAQIDLTLQAIGAHAVRVAPGCLTFLSLHLLVVHAPGSALTFCCPLRVREPIDVCFQGKIGKHLFRLSFSEFDPQQTCA